MTSFKLTACGIISVFFLLSCSEILEPVSLFGAKQDITTGAGQEEFGIKIKNLTFKTAEKANNAPYLRQLIYTGSGSKAKVVDEANFLKPNFPKSSSSPDHLLGIGDKLMFSQLNEFKTETAQWPTNTNGPEYLLGVGDTLTFTQSFEAQEEFNITLGEEGKYHPLKSQIHI